MMTDLERRLSTRLHQEAEQLVPATAPRPLPAPAVLAVSRWRTPVLAAAAVLMMAAGITVAVQSRHGGSPAAATHTSPTLTSRTPAFQCTGTATLNAARIGTERIGITADAFCATPDDGSAAAGSALRPSGPLRSWVANGTGVAGVVDPSVDRVVWVTAGSDEKSGTALALYALGTLNGFAVPTGSGGTLLLYSGSEEVARQQLPTPEAGASAASPSAQPSYPPGQGPRPKTGTWPTNARGQTYGSSAQAGAVNGEPDLIEAFATNGKVGYVLRTDMEQSPPANPSEAGARNTAASKTIPVYKSDGLTQIGVFVVSGSG